MCADSNSSLSLPSSPKIAKSFRSRLNVTLKSPTEENAAAESTYVPGETVDGFTALSPPPGGLGGGGSGVATGLTNQLSAGGGVSGLDESGGDEPPALEAVVSPGTHPMSSIVGLDGGYTCTTTATSSIDDNPASTGTIKRSSRGESPGAASLRKYAIQNSNSSALVAANNPSMVKAESNQSLISMERMCSLSEAGNGSTKRTSVVFEEPKPMSRNSNTLLMAQTRQMSTSKTVNGILRKGSLREESDRGGGGGPGATGNNNNNNNNSNSLRPEQSGGSSARKSSRRTGGGGGESRHKGEKHSKHSRSRDRGGGGDHGDEGDGGGGDGKRSSRSRSNSTKANKQENAKKENLALTRDLPWCGCWGNGCL